MANALQRPAARALRAGALLALAVLACLLGAAPAGAAPANPAARALIVFVPVTEYPTPQPNQPSLFDEIAAHPQLSLGLLGATQGGFNPSQALLDLGQGTRVSYATYHPKDAPPLSLIVHKAGFGAIRGWTVARKRAASAPADVFPGLLASAIPGGAGFAGVHDPVDPHAEAAVAADRSGRVAAVSLGRPSTLAARTTTLLKRKRLVVALMPQGPAGLRAVDTLVANRPPRELLMVIQAPPKASAAQLLRMGVAGLNGPVGTLTSPSTRQRGIVAGIDLAPTILEHLGVPVSSQMKGQPMDVRSGRDQGALEDLSKRLRVVGTRRVPAFQAVLLGWLVLVLALGLVRDRAGVRAGARIGGLALLWGPTLSLVAAAVRPAYGPELMIVAGGSFLLGALTDRFVAWPRAPLVPAAVGIVAYTIDLIRNSALLSESLLGPNPRSGSRFYGLGNELEVILTVLMLCALAGLLPRVARSTRLAWLFAAGGVVFAGIVGWGRLGADVGGVVTVAVGAAAATLLALPRRPSRRAIAVAVIAPVAALGGLAILDSATSANDHFSRTVLRSGGVHDLLVTIGRRYELAFGVLKHGIWPLLTAAALLGALYGLRHRERIYAVVRGTAWPAALGGGLAAAVAGTLSNDSGPLLLVLGVLMLAALTAYLTAGPRVPPPETAEADELGAAGDPGPGRQAAAEDAAERVRVA